MTLRSSDLQSDSDLDSIRNSCDVLNLQMQIYLLMTISGVVDFYCFAAVTMILMSCFD